MGSTASAHDKQLTAAMALQHLRPPAAYMAANWPLTVASVSRDGLDIAVAGQRGLALYSRRQAAALRCLCFSSLQIPCSHAA